MIGIVFIALEESSLNINHKGDILALGAAVLWAVYAVVLKENFVHLGYDMIVITREIFALWRNFNDTTSYF